MRLFACALAVLSVIGFAEAAAVSGEEAGTAAANWIRENPSFGRGVGRFVRGVRTTFAEDGCTALHVVKMEGGGFVVTSDDTETEPFLAVSDGEDLVESEENPLWCLLRADLAVRAKAKAVRDASGAKLLMATPSSAEAKWARYLAPVQLFGSKKARIDDVCVAPLVKSKWNQQKVTNANGDSKLCYNYYTPNNYPCGCVATTISQLLRYHRWPTNAVPANTYACAVDGVATNLTMQGGFYDWESLVLEPSGAELTLTQRQKIGKLTSDVGISVKMSYKLGGSGTTHIRANRRLNDLWGYADSKWLNFSSKWTYSEGKVKDAVIPCLAAGLPLPTSVPGHSILTDGYGYSDGDFYIHLNLGWGGVSDAWYRPAEIDNYEGGIEDFIVNASPSPCPAIFAGRVYAPDGTVDTNRCEVTAEGGGTVMKTVAGETGVYSFTAAPGTYRVRCRTAFTEATNLVTVSSTKGNRTGDSGAVIVEDPALGNRRSVDLRLAAGPLVTGGILDLGGACITGTVESANNYCDGCFGDGAVVANGSFVVDGRRFFRPDGELWVSNAVFTLPESDTTGQLNFNRQPGLVALHVVDGSVFNALSSRNDAYIGNDGSTSTGAIEVVRSVFLHPNEDFCLARARGNGVLTGLDSTVDFAGKAIYLDYNGGGKAKIALTNCSLRAYSIRIGDGGAANAKSSAVLEFIGGTNELSVISCAVTNESGGVKRALIPQVSVSFDGTVLKATRDIANYLNDGGGYDEPVFHVRGKGLTLDLNGYNLGLRSPIDGKGTVYVRGPGRLTLDPSTVFDVNFVYLDEPVHGFSVIIR